MKNKNIGFVTPVILGIITLLVIGSSVYVYQNKKDPVDTNVQVAEQVQQTNAQNKEIDQSKGSSILVLTPKTGDSLVAGQNYIITWTSNNVGDQVLFIDLKSANNTLVKMIANGIKNTGNYSWTVDSTLPQGTYQITVSTSENLPTGKNTAEGKSGFFTITSKVAMPSAPVINSASPNIAYVNNAAFGMGGTVTIKGSGFSENTIHLIDPSTGQVITDLSANTPSGNPSNSTEFTISIPNSIKPGSYVIVVENTIFGLKSQAYPLTIAASN